MGDQNIILNKGDQNHIIYILGGPKLQLSQKIFSGVPRPSMRRGEQNCYKLYMNAKPMAQ